MLGPIGKLVRLLTNPRQFYEDVRSESGKSSFVFFLWIMLFLSVATPVVNYFGVESTDLSSSCQAQIVAYNFVKNNLLETYGFYAYLGEAVLIFAFAVPILLLSTLFLHFIYRVIGGQGSILNGWKAMCYGLGPCLLGGFLPYISLFVAFYSFSIQFYLAPVTLYRAKEGRAIPVFAALIALSFIEMFVLGSTVGFG
jgi:hypothetical protein